MLRCSLRRLVEIWERTQVELHGQYSVQRVKDLSLYTRMISPWRHTLVYLLTPLPCLIVVALLDCVELEPPETGFAKSYRTWARLYLCASVVSFTELTQLHVTIPVLPLSAFRILTITLFSSVMAIASLVGFAFLIGFPVPFTFPMACPAWFSSLVIGFWYYCRDTVRGSVEMQKDVKGYLIVVVCQILITVIYPLYAYVFMQLSSRSQTGFVLLLPWIKIGAKNWISFFLGDLDDMKPEFVIFNIEIFNALYVSFCMQNSTSTLTIVSLAMVDFAQAWMSLNDMKGFARDLEALITKMPAHPGQHRRHSNILDAAIEILEKDSSLSRNPILQTMCRQTMYQDEMRRSNATHRSSTANSVAKLNVRKLSKLSSFTPFSPAKVAVAATDSTSTHADSVKATPSMVSAIPQACSSMPTPGPKIQHLHRQKEMNTEKITRELGLNVEERLLFVQKTAKVLFMIEYAVLIEYTEVVTPMIYCAYILIMFNLPNHKYYPQLVATSTNELWSNLFHVLLYALLEFVSFIAIGMIIKRKFGISKTHQLTFVLTNQWRMVQSKFIMWVMYIVQTYLYHSGADFSFQFTWLTSSQTHE